jgi:hypothetical protein
MKKNYNYNELVRFYNRSLKKLRTFIALGKNPYKQDILKRRVERLFNLLSGMQAKFNLGTVTAAAVAGFVLFQPNAAKAQVTFAPAQLNPFGITKPGTGTWTNPTFADLDNDGDKDFMTGMDDGSFAYYQNTGTASAPAFAAFQSNPFGIAGTIGYYSTTSFVDLDNDGDWDLMAGEGAGDWYYQQNTGTASAPAFGAAQMNPFGLTNLGQPYGVGSFADLDGDGDKDLMSGENTGTFIYYQNTGTATAPAFGAPQTNPFLITPIGVNYSTAAFADLDADGDFDMMSGATNGNFYYYENTGTSTAPAFTGPFTNFFSLTAQTGGNTPWFVDLDNDTDMDMMVGDAGGNFRYYQNTTPLGIKHSVFADAFGLYPNPTTSNVTLKLRNEGTYTVEVTNTLGQVVSSMEVNTLTTTIDLPEQKGLYFVKLTNPEGKTNVIKVVKN